MSNHLFGIRWRLTVSTFPDATGNAQQIVAYSDDFSFEGLHIEFDVYKTTQSSFWYADICIYNLNDPTTQLVLKQGMQVKLEAGFQNFQGGSNGPYGVIFEGALFQPIWERLDVVNYRLTLHCIVGVIEETNNFVSLSVANGLTQREIVARMAANAMNPLQANVSIPEEKLTRSSRGEVIFGQPSLYMEQIAKETDTNFWISNQAINIRNLLQSTVAPTISYGPATGLVGTPVQTQDGVDLTVLLDPRAELATQIQLTPDTVITQLPRLQNTYPTILDSSGLYVIGGVRHRGASRGNIWFTDITGYLYVGSRLALLNP
jgi:hypothetical protein